MDRTASRIIQDAKGEREEADYGDYKVVTEDEAMNQLAKAKEFVKEAEDLLENLIKAQGEEYS